MTLRASLDRLRGDLVRARPALAAHPLARARARRVLAVFAPDLVPAFDAGDVPVFDGLAGFLALAFADGPAPPVCASDDASE